jgi:hypothetical protein
MGRLRIRDGELCAGGSLTEGPSREAAARNQQTDHDHHGDHIPAIHVSLFLVR